MTGRRLDHGRLAIIQPLLVTTVVFALPLGYFLTQQQVSMREIVGAAVVVAGLALFAIFGQPSSGSDNAPNDERFVGLGLAMFGAFVISIARERRGGTRQEAGDAAPAPA